MLRFTANLSLLFTEVELSQRFKLARQHGFNGVEIQFPYELPAQTIAALLQEQELKLVLFNVAAGDLLQGGRGLAAVPQKVALFRQAIEQAAAYAEILKPEVINVLPGRTLQTRQRDLYLQTFLSNLNYALDVFTPLGITTVFEAVNTIDMPGFLVNSSQHMLDILAYLNHPNLAMQYDIYHMVKMGEQPEKFIKLHAGKIGHIQFADCPGRAQPGTGNINFKTLFSTIIQSAYRGWVGAEYNPTGGTVQSLTWLTNELNS